MPNTSVHRAIILLYRCQLAASYFSSCHRRLKVGMSCLNILRHVIRSLPLLSLLSGISQIIATFACLYSANLNLHSSTKFCKLCVFLALLHLCSRRYIMKFVLIRYHQNECVCFRNESYRKKNGYLPSLKFTKNQKIIWLKRHFQHFYWMDVWDHFHPLSMYRLNLGWVDQEFIFLTVI